MKTALDCTDHKSSRRTVSVGRCFSHGGAASRICVRPLDHALSLVPDTCTSGKQRLFRALMSLSKALGRRVSAALTVPEPSSVLWRPRNHSSALPGSTAARANPLPSPIRACEVLASRGTMSPSS